MITRVMPQRATAFRVACGWLTAIGVMHFAVDVLSQYARGMRPPSAETTAYYGLNSSFALGQFVLGLAGLQLARRAPRVLGEPLHGDRDLVGRQAHRSSER